MSQARMARGFLWMAALAMAIGGWARGTLADEAGDAFAPITRFMEDRVAEGKLAGLSTLVAHQGEVVYFENVGRRDIERDLPMTEDTLFRIHSMTKPIAAVALMILYDEGRVALDDPIAKYIPEFADMRVYVSGKGDDMVTEPAARQITLLDVLTHQSGISYSFFGPHPVHDIYEKVGLGDYGEGKPPFTLAEMMTRLSKVPLVFQPGTRWQYSMSTDVVARVVEIVSGQPIGTFLKERIFDPLRMTDTAYFVADDKIERLSASYDIGSGKLVLADDPQTSIYRKAPVFAGGGSGLVSSATDYFRFSQMLLNRGALDDVRILKPETVDLMTSDHLYRDAGVKFIPGGGVGLGLGVVVDDTAEGQVPGSVGEYYWGGSSNTYFWINPRKDLVIVVMAQLRGRGQTFGDDIKEMVYEAYAGQ